jgi:hypothetical protein
MAALKQKLMRLEELHCKATADEKPASKMSYSEASFSYFVCNSKSWSDFLGKWAPRDAYHFIAAYSPNCF